MVKRMPPYSIWCRSPVTRFRFRGSVGVRQAARFRDRQVQPELPRGAWASAIVTDRVVARRRLLDETDHVIVVDLDKTQIRGLLQGRIAASELVERPI